MQRAHEENINTPKYWEEYTGASYRSNTRKSGQPRYIEVIKHIDEKSNILDVGCNFGDFCKYMYEKSVVFKEYTGYDFSEVAIENAKTVMPEDTWILGDCDNLKLEKNKYNTVVAMQLIEHLEKPDKFFKRAYGYLKDDGKIILTVPNSVRIQHESHVWYFDEDDIYKLLYAAGFREIDITIINQNQNILAVAKKFKKITIVTPVLCPSRNVFNTIEKCFKSIRNAADEVNAEWIIVDDNSAYGREFFSKIADVYLRNNETTGVSTSLNRGMKIGSGSFMVKLDSDYLVPKNLFEILLQDWSDDLAFIAPSFTGGDSNKEEHFDISKIPEPEGGAFDKPSGISNLSKYGWGGGILMFNAENIKEIDYFDEGFNIGSAQDNDVIYRILMKGYNWRWTNNVLTRHFASISSNDPNAPDTRTERRRIGKEIFKEKHGFEPGGYLSYVFQHFKYKDKNKKYE